MKVLEYLSKIEEEGYEAYIVGGYVRDYILGYESTDIDITTNASPREIAKIFDLKVSDELGCINIKSSKYNIDITTFRKESSYFGHRPKKVSYVNDLLTDLKRRDFTVNTICMNSKGEIIDLLNGQNDLKNRELKVVGKVKKKFMEDPLRMLRALRFSIVYDLKMGEEELMFILNNKRLFESISYDRKKEEIGKILISENVLKGLDFLKTLNILEVLEIDYPIGMVASGDYIGMWAQLKYSDNYKFSKVENERLNNIREILNNQEIDEMVLFKYGLYDTLVGAKILGVDAGDVNEMYKSMQIHSEDELAIKGNDIKDILGIPSGPKIKEIKDDLICKIVSGNLSNKKESLTLYLKENWK